MQASRPSPAPPRPAHMRTEYSQNLQTGHRGQQVLAGPSRLLHSDSTSAPTLQQGLRPGWATTGGDCAGTKGTGLHCTQTRLLPQPSTCPTGPQGRTVGHQAAPPPTSRPGKQTALSWPAQHPGPTLRQVSPSWGQAAQCHRGTEGAQPAAAGASQPLPGAHGISIIWRTSHRPQHPGPRTSTAWT